MLDSRLLARLCSQSHDTEFTTNTDVRRAIPAGRYPRHIVMSGKRIIGNANIVQWKVPIGSAINGQYMIAVEVAVIDGG